MAFSPPQPKRLPSPSLAPSPRRSKSSTPVAVAGEHASVLLRTAAARERDYGGTLLRGDVPALELKAVAGREGHVLVGGAQVRGRHVRSHHVRAHVAEGEPADELARHHECSNRQ